MNTPLVSIIVVCHNDWPHLELTLESALAQTHPAIEVILVDNDSSDATRAEVEEHYSHRLTYVRQGNLGTAAGRNAGIQHARGAYIQFLDGDDFLAPNKIARQVAFLESHGDVDIAYGDFRTFRSTPDVSAASLFDKDTEDWPDMKALLLSHCPGPPIIFLLRRSVIDRVGLQNERIFFEDYEYWLRCAFAEQKFARTPEAWAFYRRRAGQKSGQSVRAAASELTVLYQSRAFVTKEPYRTQLATRIARLEYAFAHHHLLKGQLVQARVHLSAALATAPPQLRFAQARFIQWMSRIPLGPTLYAAARWFRRLPPPFTASLRFASGTSR